MSQFSGVSIDNTGTISPGSTARLSTSIDSFKNKIKPLCDVVIAAQAALNDTTKVQSELFNDKARSLFPAIGQLIDVPLNGSPLTLDQYVAAAFSGSVASWDAALIGFKNKIYWNSARPVTTIRWLYNSSTITTWVKKLGAVSGVPGYDFLPYIKTPAHTDYPSTSTLYFAAFAAAEKAYFGADAFGFAYTYATGASTVEPLLTPAAPVTITASTFSQYSNLGGQARFLGGGKSTFVWCINIPILSFVLFHLLVHFQEDVDESWRIAKIVGPLSTSFVKNLLAGQKARLTPTALVSQNGAPTPAPIAFVDNPPVFTPISPGATAVIVFVVFIGAALIFALLHYVVIPKLFNPDASTEKADTSEFEQVSRNGEI